jgi:hypothetical protein
VTVMVTVAVTAVHSEVVVAATIKWVPTLRLERGTGTLGLAALSVTLVGKAMPLSDKVTFTGVVGAGETDTVRVTVWPNGTVEGAAESINTGALTV